MESSIASCNTTPLAIQSTRLKLCFQMGAMHGILNSQIIHDQYIHLPNSVSSLIKWMHKPRATVGWLQSERTYGYILGEISPPLHSDISSWERQTWLALTKTYK